MGSSEITIAWKLVSRVFNNFLGSFRNPTISRFFIAGGGHAVIVVSFGNFTFLAAAEGEGTMEGWLAAHGVLLVLSVAGGVKENGALREESG